MVTVEAAFALCALVLAAGLCCTAIVTMTTYVQCVDAAREAARLVARGDGDRAAEVVHRTLPTAALAAAEADGLVTATVSARARVLPLSIVAQAVSRVEMVDQ